MLMPPTAKSTVLKVGLGLFESGCTIREAWKAWAKLEEVA
jgi:hypothetical protein